MSLEYREQSLKEWLLDQHNLSVTNGQHFSFFGKTYRELVNLEETVITLKEELKTERQVSEFWEERYNGLVRLVESSKCSDLLD